MPITIQQIRDLIDSGAIPFNDNVIATGTLGSPDGTSVDYQLHHGWDLAKANECDKRWGEFNIDLFDFIAAQQYQAEKLSQVLAEIQVDDAHWEWLPKSCVYKTAEYNWFFLMTGNIPQGACLIYHPKPSAFEAGDIFYIEYLAVAPWNRRNPMRPQVFKGIGTALIKYAAQFASANLGLKPGFSLHALPRAAGFYEAIGMQIDAGKEKDTMPYYEMLSADTTKFIGA